MYRLALAYRLALVYRLDGSRLLKVLGLLRNSSKIAVVSLMVKLLLLLVVLFFFCCCCFSPNFLWNWRWEERHQYIGPLLIGQQMGQPSRLLFKYI